MSNVNWDTYARHYDTISSLVPYSEMISLVAATIEREHGSLLDASCGTGNLEAELMLWPQNSDLSITGVDISPVMLKRATEKLSRYRNLRFNQADLNRPLFFESGSFGQVACINTLYAVHNPEFVLDEFHRVLAPGGKIVIVSPKKGFENGLIMPRALFLMTFGPADTKARTERKYSYEKQSKMRSSLPPSFISRRLIVASQKVRPFTFSRRTNWFHLLNCLSSRSKVLL